jgi:hypothetical protein
MRARSNTKARTRVTGREAPMVITPRQVARVLREIATTLRKRKR